MSQSTGVTVGSLLRGRTDTSGLALELLTGAGGLGRRITSPHVQKTGLALAGFHEYLKPGRVLVFGESELRYLEGLDHTARTAALDLALAHDIPCILVTGGHVVDPLITSRADAAAVPILRTPTVTPIAIARLASLLEDTLAERTILHAVLIDVLGLGTLLTGESGIGKSECALDLIVRGHRLVADDTVEVHRRADTVLIGTCPELTRHHMELRGLGIINVCELFGVSSTRSSKRIEFVVRLERWDPARDYDRLGLDDRTEEILGVKVPLVAMPVAPGRNIAMLVEVAARNQLLRARGHHAARMLAERLDRALSGAAVPGDPAEDDDIEDGSPE